jgi:hypothetical protein
MLRREFKVVNMPLRPPGVKSKALACSIKAGMEKVSMQK